MLVLALALTTAVAQPEPTLVPLLERARVSVPDAREIRDLQICPPRRVSRDGRKFDTFVALSRPREPRSYYTASWRDGRVVSMTLWPIDSSVGPTAGFATLILRDTERRFEACRWVPAADLAAAWDQLDR